MINTKDMAMTTLSVSNLCYSIGTKTILEDVTFSIEEGDRLGIVGVNGSGKTTLLRLITGMEKAERGDIYFAKDKVLGMLRQDDPFQALEGADTVLAQMYAAFPGLVRDEERLAQLEEEMEGAPTDRLLSLSAEFERLNTRFIDGGGLHYKSRCKSLLQKLGFEEETHQRSISTLSGGQRTRLALARLLFQEPDILILDEPTNHLDIDTMAWLEGHLAGYKKTLLLVSHDRYFLDRVTNRTLDIEHHKAKLYKCAYTAYKKQKEEERAALEKQYMLQQREIARLEAFIEQQRRWNRERNIIAAESREKAIARMDKIERPEDAPRTLQFAFSKTVQSGNDVLDVKNLAIGFGEKNLFTGLTFSVKRGERLLITGPNGCGKSSLLKALLGKLPTGAGSVTFGYNVRVGYYDQENQNLSPDKTVLDELWDAYPTIGRRELYSVLAVFMFRGEDVEKTVSVLSGGERARLTLAKLILSKVNVLILDEPTNHLDISSREALENALDAFEGTVIAVSHDRYFMQRLATRILSLGDPARDFRGGYTEYAAAQEQTEEATAAAPAKTAIPTGKELYLKKKEEQAALRRREARRKKVIQEIARLEKELADITDRLYGEDAADYVKAAQLEDQRIYVEDQLMQLYEEEADFSVAEDVE